MTVSNETPLLQGGGVLFDDDQSLNPGDELIVQPDEIVPARQGLTCKYQGSLGARGKIPVVHIGHEPPSQIVDRDPDVACLFNG